MDSVTRFMALLTVSGAAAIGAATPSSAVPVSNDLKILCERGVEEACRTVGVEAQLNPIWGFDEAALALYGFGGSSESSSSDDRPDTQY